MDLTGDDQRENEKGYVFVASFNEVVSSTEESSELPASIAGAHLSIPLTIRESPSVVVKDDDITLLTYERGPGKFNCHPQALPSQPAPQKNGPTVTLQSTQSIVDDDTLQSTIKDCSSTVYSFDNDSSAEVPSFFKPHQSASTLPAAARNPTRLETLEELQDKQEDTVGPANNDMLVPSDNGLRNSTAVSKLPYDRSNSITSSMLSDEEKFDQEWSLLQDELGRLIEEKGFMDLQVALVYGKLGEALEINERYDEALEFYGKRLEIEKKVVAATSDPSDGHLQMASTYRRIAKFLARQYEYEEAMKELEKVVVINLKFHGPNHPDTGATYQAMGECYRCLGKGDDAMEHYQNAVKAYGPKHLQSGKIYCTMGWMFEWQGKIEQAIEQFQNALNVYGREHPKTSEIYRDIGSLFEQQCMYEEAMERFQMALDISLKVHGPGACTTRDAYDRMGEILALGAEDDEAVRKQTERELATNLKAYGPELQRRYRHHLLRFLKGKERELYKKRWGIEEVLNRSLKNDGIAITITQFDGESAVVEACFPSQIEIAGLGSEAEAGVDVEVDGDIHGASQGMKACFRGHIHKIVEVLLKNGVDRTAVDHNGRTALMYASKKGFTEIVELLLGKGVCHTVKDKFGMTAMIAACCFGHAEIVRMLVANGADPTVTDNHGSSALMVACFFGHTEIVRLLLANGADPTVSDKDGTTALMLASRKGFTEIVRLLLANGADHSVEDNYGHNALIHAAQGFMSKDQFFKIVKLLLENGADPTVTDKDGTTALMYASEKGFTEMVRLLLANGADHTVTDKDGTTALMLASRKGFTEIVRLLLANGADPTATNKDGDTVLKHAAGPKYMPAARKRHFEIVMLLVQHGADPNLPDYTNTTPLMVGARKGYIETVEFLLQNGADITKMNGYEHTALDLARREGHAEIVKLLSNHSPPNKNVKQQTSDCFWRFRFEFPTFWIRDLLQALTATPKEELKEN